MHDRTTAQEEIAVGPEAVAHALSALARDRFGAGARVESVRRLSGGASQEIWSFDVHTAEGLAPLILRRVPAGLQQRAGAAAMATEARLIALAGDHGVPVPAIAAVLSPGDGLGDGYVMARVPGETLARRILRDDAFADARKVLARQLGQAAARLHAIPAAQAQPLNVSTVAGALDGARERYRANAIRKPVVEWALRWLDEHRPADMAAPAIVHGDLRNGNIMVGPEGLRALLDWEVVHLGDPAEDLGWLCVTSWRFGAIDLPVGGLGTRADLFAGYVDVAGAAPDADRVRWFEVMGTLRWGLSCSLMAREFQRGDRSVERAAIGRRASETEIDLLSILAPLTGMTHA